MSSVLAGIRVLDFGRYIAGPYCAAVLGDFGAEVIRIDRLGGGEDRFVMPVGTSGGGAVFLQSNRNKRSIALDIDKPQGREVVRRLVRSADVVVVNMPPQTLLDLGLDYDTLSQIRPDIIVTTASAFGSTGPNRNKTGLDGIGQCLSGAVYLSGTADHPTKAMVPYVDFGTALACAMGTIAALYERKTSGKGQHVEGSLLNTALTIASNSLIEEGVLNVGREAIGNRTRYGSPSDIFRVRDGWIMVQVLGQSTFKRWTRLIARPDLFEDPRLQTDLARGDHGEELSGLMGQWCATRTREEALNELERSKIPAGPVQSPRQVLDDPHVKAEGILQPTDYPGLARPAPLVKMPVTLSRTPGEIRHRAPLVGEHTDAILQEAGYGADEIAHMRQLGLVGGIAA